MRKICFCTWWLWFWTPCAWGIVQMDVSTGKQWLETSHNSNEKFRFRGQEDAIALRFSPVAAWPLYVGVSYTLLQLNPDDFYGSPTRAEIQEIGGEISYWLPFFEKVVPFFTLQVLLNGRLLVNSTANLDSGLHGGRALVGIRYRVLPISTLEISGFQGMYQADDIEGAKRSLSALGVLVGFDVSL